MAYLSYERNSLLFIEGQTHLEQRSFCRRFYGAFSNLWPVLAGIWTFLSHNYFIAPSSAPSLTFSVELLTVTWSFIRCQFGFWERTVFLGVLEFRNLIRRALSNFRLADRLAWIWIYLWVMRWQGRSNHMSSWQLGRGKHPLSLCSLLGLYLLLWKERQACVSFASATLLITSFRCLNTGP